MAVEDGRVKEVMDLFPRVRGRVFDLHPDLPESATASEYRRTIPDMGLAIPVLEQNALRYYHIPVVRLEEVIQVVRLVSEDRGVEPWKRVMSHNGEKWEFASSLWTMSLELVTKMHDIPPMMRAFRENPAYAGISIVPDGNPLYTAALRG